MVCSINMDLCSSRPFCLPMFPTVYSSRANTRYDSSKLDYGMNKKVYDPPPRTFILYSILDAILNVRI